MPRRTAPARLALIALGWIALLACSVRACLWDSDTLRTEAKGMPSVIQAITGRFDRFPPLYYEMRLARVEREVIDRPDDLAHYDDAAVALDRLGRPGEAIDWMARKLEALNRLEAAGADTADHRYRYLANLGTFHAHRWISAGADRADLTDLHRARELIAQAIELNPDAHFGRERYQLLAIRSLLEPPEHDDLIGRVPILFDVEPSLMGAQYFSPRNRLAQAGFTDASDGLAGLVMLGTAWESVDIFNTLTAVFIDRGEASVAMLAAFRRDELIGLGRTTLFPTPDTEELEWIRARSVYDSQVPPVTDYYATARLEADEWVAARNTYAIARLQRGEHPDTHSEFWTGWSDPHQPPVMPDGLWGRVPEEVDEATAVLVALAAAAALASGVIYLMRRYGRRSAARSPA